MLIFDEDGQHYSQFLPVFETSMTKQKPTNGAGRGIERRDVKLSVKEQKQGRAILRRKQVSIAEIKKTFLNLLC